MVHDVDYETASELFWETYHHHWTYSLAHREEFLLQMFGFPYNALWTNFKGGPVPGRRVVPLKIMHFGRVYYHAVAEENGIYYDPEKDHPMTWEELVDSYKAEDSVVEEAARVVERRFCD